MFIVNLTYQCELSEIDQHLAAHIQYLEKCYQLGYFLMSGRKEPRDGGVIVATAPTKAQLMDILSEDPFYQHRLARYDIIEFVATKTAPALAQYQQC